MGTYVIKQGNKIKIGVTKNIKTRLSSYNTHSAEETILLKWNRDDLFGRSKELHFKNKYSKQRIRNTEWFENSEELENELIHTVYNSIDEELFDKSVEINQFDEPIIVLKYCNQLHEITSYDNVLILNTTLYVDDKFKTVSIICDKFYYIDCKDYEILLIKIDSKMYQILSHKRLFESGYKSSFISEYLLLPNQEVINYIKRFKNIDEELEKIDIQTLANDLKTYDQNN